MKINPEEHDIGTSFAEKDVFRFIDVKDKVVQPLFLCLVVFRYAPFLLRQMNGV